MVYIDLKTQGSNNLLGSKYKEYKNKLHQNIIFKLQQP